MITRCGLGLLTLALDWSVRQLLSYVQSYWWVVTRRLSTYGGHFLLFRHVFLLSLSPFFYRCPAIFFFYRCHGSFYPVILLSDE